MGGLVENITQILVQKKYFAGFFALDVLQIMISNKVIKLKWSAIY